MAGNYKPRSVTLDMIAALGLIASVEANSAEAHGLASDQELKLAADTLASPGIQVEYRLFDHSWIVSSPDAQSMPASPPTTVVAQSMPASPPTTVVAQSMPASPPTTVVAQSMPASPPTTVVAQSMPASPPTA